MVDSSCLVKLINWPAFVVVAQLLNQVQLFATSWTVAHQASLSFTISQDLLKFMSIESVMLSNHLILYHSLLLLTSVFPIIRIFSSQSVLHIRWPKYQSFSISPSNDSSEFIAFRIDWFDLLATRETLKSLLLHHNLKASTLQYSAFFMVQLLNPYLTTGKTIIWLERPLSAKWCSLELWIQLGISFPFSLAFHFPSFLSYL